MPEATRKTLKRLIDTGPINAHRIEGLKDHRRFAIPRCRPRLPRSSDLPRRRRVPVERRAVPRLAIRAQEVRGCGTAHEGLRGVATVRLAPVSVLARGQRDWLGFGRPGESGESLDRRDECSDQGIRRDGGPASVRCPRFIGSSLRVRDRDEVFYVMMRRDCDHHDHGDESRRHRSVRVDAR